jgi:hypothetical protein
MLNLSASKAHYHLKELENHTGGLGPALISMSLWLFREVRRMEQH